MNYIEKSKSITIVELPIFTKAFDGIKTNKENIKSYTISNNIISLNFNETNNDIVEEKIISSILSSNINSILTQALVTNFYNGMWTEKTTFDGTDLKGTTEISTSTFGNKNLTSLAIPNSVASIGVNALSYNKLTSLIQ